MKAAIKCFFGFHVPVFRIYHFRHGFMIGDKCAECGAWIDPLALPTTER